MNSRQAFQQIALILSRKRDNNFLDMPDRKFLPIWDNTSSKGVYSDLMGFLLHNGCNIPVRSKLVFSGEWF